jgi:hypothetical protein
MGYADRYVYVFDRFNIGIDFFEPVARQAIYKNERLRNRRVFITADFLYAVILLSKEIFHIH